jgi:hypothetical protein
VSGREHACEGVDDRNHTGRGQGEMSPCHNWRRNDLGGTKT